MKNSILTIILLTCFSSAFSQQSDFTSMGRGVSTTFVTDYHTTGINPANLGFKRKYETKHVTLGLLEIGLSSYSGALQKTEFRESIFNFDNEDFTFDQKQKAASQFTDQPLALNADINWLGFSYQNDKIGGLSFNIRETGRWYSSFNQNLSEILFLGYKASYFDKLVLNNGDTLSNIPANYNEADSVGILGGYNGTGGLYYSQLFEGSNISIMAYREYALNYGKEITINDYFSVAGGVGVKYIQGLGIMNISVKDGEMRSYGAFSPILDVNFGSATKFNPSLDTSGGYKPVGSGWGFDFGFNIYYKEKIKIGFALTNIGSIQWTGNVYSAKDTVLYNMQSEGFSNYNIFSQAANIASDEGLFKWDGKQKLVTKLPTTLRMGISHEFEDKGEIGFDMIIPMNNQPGSLRKPYWAIGGDFKVFRFLKLSSGVAYGGNFDKRVNIPVGITLIAGEQAAWEIGFASRDAVTFFRQKGPALSMAFGFLRFRI